MGRISSTRSLPLEKSYLWCLLLALGGPFSPYEGPSFFPWGPCFSFGCHFSMICLFAP